MQWARAQVIRPTAPFASPTATTPLSPPWPTGTPLLADFDSGENDRYKITVLSTNRTFWITAKDITSLLPVTMKPTPVSQWSTSAESPSTEATAPSAPSSDDVNSAISVLATALKAGGSIVDAVKPAAKTPAKTSLLPQSSSGRPPSWLGYIIGGAAGLLVIVAGVLLLRRPAKAPRGFLGGRK